MPQSMEAFEAACHLVQQRIASIDDVMKLQLYGLYKQATEGPPSGPAPSWFHPTASRKYKAWAKVASLDQHAAQMQYVKVVENQFGKLDAQGTAHRGSTMGPVSSKPIFEPDAAETEENVSLCTAAALGDLDRICSLIDMGNAVNDKNQALHMAVDRGHVSIVSHLLQVAGVDVNCQDEDGSTPLHFAAVCEREEIVSMLLKAGADRSQRDRDGLTPIELCPDYMVPLFN